MTGTLGVLRLKAIAVVMLMIVGRSDGLNAKRYYH